MAPQLADGLELWLGTCGHLPSMGVEVRPAAELMQFMQVLDQADPDPFVVGVRRMVYGPPPARPEVETLLASVDLATVRPRTLAWLAMACYRTDVALAEDIFGRALRQYPDDFMLNFDRAYSFYYVKRWDMAIRSYERCLAIRPQSAGVWRALGAALREIEDLAGSADALERSIELQPEHAPTWVELGVTREKLGQPEAARDAYEQALAIRSDISGAAEGLERLEAAPHP
jgi:tetratricopeptide (TPR) repeat protein